MPANHLLPAVGQTTIGLRTPFGTWVPPGARVAAYVGPQSESTDTYSSSGLLVATLQEGFARCRSGKGDVVFVLPGHTQTITTQTLFTNLVAGTQIIGCAPYGSGLMPTLTVTGTTTVATSTINVANVQMSGIRWNLNGADSMDTPLVVTAAGCNINNCIFLTGSDTALDADVAVTVSTGADFFNLSGCYFYSTGTAVNTNSVLVSAAVDSLNISDNTFMVPAVASGIVQLGASTVVLTNLMVARNLLVNKSTGLITIGYTDQAHTGMICDNYSQLTADATLTTDGIKAAGLTNPLIQFAQNFLCDGGNKGRSGILQPAVQT